MKNIIGLIAIVFVIGNSSCIASTNEKSPLETNLKNETSNVIKYAEDMSTFNELISSNQPVLVDFYADWCAPCRMMAPILQQVSGEMEGKVKVVKVNVDKNREAATKYGIRSIPTLILFQNGEIKWQGVGVIQADQIKQIVLSKTN